MNIPYIAYIDEGTKIDLSFKKIFQTVPTLLDGVPWRLRTVSFQCSSRGKTNSVPSPDPAIFQVELNSGMNSNVEGIINQRYLITPYQTTKRTLRMRSPNLWKEDEQRDQVLISLQNCDTESEVNNMSRVFCMMTVRFQFGRIPFAAPKSLSHLAYRIPPSSSYSDLTGSPCQEP